MANIILTVRNKHTQVVSRVGLEYFNSNKDTFERVVDEAVIVVPAVVVEDEVQEVPKKKNKNRTK